MTWREKTELDKAVAYEAIRGRLPDVWTLLDIVESANPPDYHDDPGSPGSPAWHDITFAARDGWQVTIFYDGGELDYVTEIHAPDGLTIDPWDWPYGAPGCQMLINWRAVGDRARMMALREECSVQTIDCTALQGDRPVNEDERDGILFGRIDLLGGYLDSDPSVVRRTPVPGGFHA